MLKKLANVNPNSRWWIKGDDTDVIKGLWESVSGVETLILMMENLINCTSFFFFNEMGRKSWSTVPDY